VGYSTTVRYLHELGYNLRVPRPCQNAQNEEERNAFLEQLRAWQADPQSSYGLPTNVALRRSAPAPALERSGQSAKSALSRRPYP